jgi:hypothetical protein
MEKRNFAEELLRNQTPALKRAFAEKSNSLFVNSSSNKARIDVFTPESLRAINRMAGEESCKHDGPPPLQKSMDIPYTDESLLESLSIRDAATLEEYMRSVKGTQFYFLGQQNSYSALNTSRQLFDLISHRRSVSPQFRDFILYMGKRESEIEIVPPAFRLRQKLTFKDSSYFTCEFMSGLRFVEPNFRADVSEVTAQWSLRQSAIYYQATGMPREQTWIFTTLSELCKQRLRTYLSYQETVNQTHPLEIYVLLIDTVMGNWRPYLVTLSLEIEQHASQLLGASQDNRSPISMADAGQQQILMVLQEKLSNAILALQALQADLKIMNTHIVTDNSTHLNLVRLIAQEKVEEAERLILKAEALRSRLDAIALLVSSTLELSNGFVLQQLGKESRRENEQMRVLSERMHLLTEKSTQDAAAVKVLTIITLVYLPFTVTTNFFSTSFVGVSTSANHIYLTRDWWILFATGMPLTLMTVYIWWVWSRIQAYQKWPWWWFRSSRPLQQQPEIAT